MNEMREPLLQIENLSTHFHMFKGTVKAVDGVSFFSEPGEILGVVGESGSGKSVTSFSIIGLVDEPGEVKADKIIFDGKDLTALSGAGHDEDTGQGYIHDFPGSHDVLKSPVYHRKAARRGIAAAR